MINPTARCAGAALPVENTHVRFLPLIILFIGLLHKFLTDYPTTNGTSYISCLTHTSILCCALAPSVVHASAV
jgi:hypothetical protein